MCSILVSAKSWYENCNIIVREELIAAYERSTYREGEDWSIHEKYLSNKKNQNSLGGL